MDAINLGDLANPDVLGDEYKIKTLDNQAGPLEVTAAGDGRLWLIVGTDSGFEGLTALYHRNVTYSLSAVEVPAIGPIIPPPVGDAAPSGPMLELAAAAGVLLSRTGPDAAGEATAVGF